MFNWVNEIQKLKKDLATSETDLNEKISNKTTLFTHHFVVGITHNELAVIPEGYHAELVFNVISNSGTPYAKLETLDGDGYIINAFGFLFDDTAAPTDKIFEGKLFYKALNGGSILLNVHDMTTGTVSCAVVSGMNNYELVDGVHRI